MLYNPKWLQATLYIIILFVLPVLSVILVYWSVNIWLNESLANTGPLLLLACVCCWTFYSYLPFVKYIPAKVTYDKDGLNVTLNDEIHRYPWADIKKTKNSSMLGMLLFFDENKKCIYTVHKITPGFIKFEGFAKHQDLGWAD